VLVCYFFEIVDIGPGDTVVDALGEGVEGDVDAELFEHFERDEGIEVVVLVNASLSEGLGVDCQGECVEPALSHHLDELLGVVGVGKDVQLVDFDSGGVYCCDLVGPAG
jgi:hypothetical protein